MRTGVSAIGVSVVFVVTGTALCAQDADHEDLVAGSAFASGAVLASQGVGVEISDLVTSFFTTSGQYSVFGGSDLTGAAGTPSHEVNVNNVTATYTFDQVYTTLTFDFGEFGGDNTFEINGDKREFGDMASYFSANPVIGGVAFSLASVSGQQGTVVGTGSFSSVSFGGQELFIDNVRAVPVPGAAGLVGLAGLAAARRRR